MLNWIQCENNVPLLRKQGATQQGFVLEVPLLRFCCLTIKWWWLGDLKISFISPGRATQQFLTICYYTPGPRLTAECTMTQASKISVLWGSHSFTFHYSKDWIIYYFSNFLSAKHSNMLNKYLLNVIALHLSQEGKSIQPGQQLNSTHNSWWGLIDT